MFRNLEPQNAGGWSGGAMVLGKLVCVFCLLVQPVIIFIASEFFMTVWMIYPIMLSAKQKDLR